MARKSLLTGAVCDRRKIRAVVVVESANDVAASWKFSYQRLTLALSLQVPALLPQLLSPPAADAAAVAQSWKCDR